MNRKTVLDKDKLQNEITKNLKTVMIGAIAAIEEKFGILWGHGKNALGPNEQRLYELFLDLRKTILDNGNTQIRVCKQTLDEYEIEYIGFNYIIKLPIVNLQKSQ